jgi:hypothetical protein
MSFMAEKADAPIVLILLPKAISRILGSDKLNVSFSQLLKASFSIVVIVSGNLIYSNVAVDVTF